MNNMISESSMIDEVSNVTLSTPLTEPNEAERNANENNSFPTKVGTALGAFIFLLASPALVEAACNSGDYSEPQKIGINVTVILSSIIVGGFLGGITTQLCCTYTNQRHHLYNRREEVQENENLIEAEARRQLFIA